MLEPATNPGVVARLQVSGPRYTSYPTADRFVETFDSDEYLRAASAVAGAAAETRGLSLYVHIPFCASLCYYCGCNKIVTRHRDRAAPYLRYLAREAGLQAALIGDGRTVTQLHLGGGTPTFFSDDELRELMAVLRSRSQAAPGGECSIEVDPRTVDAVRLRTLAELGFNRISFGVQDFDPAVQAAVHRVQPFEQVEALMTQARGIG
jgi:oxygen-independent coproporphyrinogen-3 oxidase